MSQRSPGPRWRALVGFVLACLASGLARAETVPEFEQRLAAEVGKPGITVVHFWASWCVNCHNEHKDDGWKNLIAANPDVTFIFVSIWGSEENDAAQLARHGLGAMANLQLWRHPNQAKRGAERMAQVLGRDVTWIPTTWVFRESRQRYAINYGEVRFPMLQQMIDDSRPGQW